MQNVYNCVDCGTRSKNERELLAHLPSCTNYFRRIARDVAINGRLQARLAGIDAGNARGGRRGGAGGSGAGDGGRRRGGARRRRGGRGVVPHAFGIVEPNVEADVGEAEPDDAVDADVNNAAAPTVEEPNAAPTVA